MNLVARGTTLLFRGLRTGDQARLLTGAALVAAGLWRGSRRRRRELVHREVLSHGRGLVIRTGSGDEPRLQIARQDQRTR